MIEALGLAVAIAAAYFAWRANHKSDAANEIAGEANTIAAKALAISEREEQERQREREARARLAIERKIIGYEPDEQGAIRLGGSAGNLRLEITIRNDGDRSAGRAKVEVTFPHTVNDTSIRWSNAGGHPLPDSEQAGRRGETNVIAHSLDSVGRDIPERLYLTFGVAVPSGDAINYYEVWIRVAAEGMDGEQENLLPLRIGHEPT